MRLARTKSLMCLQCQQSQIKNQLRVQGLRTKAAQGQSSKFINAYVKSWRKKMMKKILWLLCHPKYLEMIGNLITNQKTQKMKSFTPKDRRSQSNQTDQNILPSLELKLTR